MSINMGIFCEKSFISELLSDDIMATKRKVVCKPLHEKYSALIEVENGGKKTDIAAMYGVPLNTLSTWIKNAEKIKNSFKSGEQNLARKRIRISKFEEIDSALLKWFSARLDEGAAISGPILMEKANKFASELGYPEFKCTVSWVTTFKERHGIKLRSVQGEEKSVDVTTVENWHKTVWQNILQNYEAKDIFNCDESGLFYKLLPNKTLSFKGQKCAGGKLSKDRITVLFCVNMDGSYKYPLLTIGKSEKPRCFKGQVTLPTEYKSNRKAWMTAELFTEWLRKFDRKMAAEKRKGALLLDNCAAHPKTVPNLKAVELFFLPPNTTSILQPLDQGIIRNFKHYYRTSVNRKHVEALDKGTEFKMSVLDALIEAQRAWERVTAQTISNCWLHMTFNKATQGSISSPTEEFTEYVCLDDNVLTSEAPTDQDIIEEIKNDKEESDHEDEVIAIEPPPPPTSAEAEAACDVMRRYLMSKLGSESELLKLCSIEDFIARSMLAGIKQSQIPDFFKK